MISSHGTYTSDKHSQPHDHNSAWGGVGGEDTCTPESKRVKDNTIFSSPLFFGCGGGVWVGGRYDHVNYDRNNMATQHPSCKAGLPSFFRGRGGDELPSHRRHTFFYKLQESLRLQEKQLYVILSCIPSKREALCLGLAVCCARTRCAERS